MNLIPSSRPESPDSTPCFRHRARALWRGRLVFGTRTARPRPAFTLPEILIAIALIVLVGGFTVTNFIHLADNVGKKSMEQTLRDAIREARFQSKIKKIRTILYYDKETGSFKVTDDTDGPLTELPTELDPTLDTAELTFAPILPQKDADSPFIETEPELSKFAQHYLMFHPSGVTTPCKVTFNFKTETISFYLDAFSAGPPPKHPNGPGIEVKTAPL